MPELAAEGVRQARRRWAIAAGLLLLVLAAVGGVVAAGEGGARSDRSTAAPSPDEVARIHAALHETDRLCKRSGLGSAERRVLQRDAERFIRFARAYPRAQFLIDGEEGHALSLLLVAREALRRCDPGAAATVAGAVPATMRGNR